MSGPYLGEPYPGQGGPPTRPAFGPFAATDVAPVSLSTAPASPATGPSGRVERMPTRPVGYLQLLRGPTWRWWRSPLSLALLVAVFIVAVVPILLISVAYAWLSGAGEPGNPMSELDNLRTVTPTILILTDLLLASLIPAAVLATWAVHRVRPGFVASVAGRFRWRWLARALLLVAAVWIPYLGLSFLIVTLTGEPLGSRPEQWPTLVAITVLLTPLQAAGEEYLFRGWLSQQVAGYFRSEKVGLVVATAVSATLFALAHGSLDPWILAELAVFATAASLLTWRTGGLEAAIALHVLNNVLLGLLTIAIGGWDQAFVGEESAGTPENVAISLVAHAVVVAVVWRWTVRTKLPTRFRPVPGPDSERPGLTA